MGPKRHTEWEAESLRIKTQIVHSDLNSAEKSSAFYNYDHALKMSILTNPDYRDNSLYQEVVKEEKPAERYFIVFYAGWNSLHGHYLLIMHEGKYPQHKFIEEKIEEDCGMSVAITNIIELSKEDFDSWVSKEG